jgi:hypothetical protein
MDDFSQQVFDRLPLNQCFFALLRFALAPDDLERLFQEHRGRCYSRKLSFQTLVELVCDAVVKHQGSANKALTAAAQRGQLPVAKKNVYEKLGRVPEQLSMALLAHASQRLNLLFGQQIPNQVTADLACLRDVAKRVIDGKKIKKVAKRLKALRPAAGKLLGGKTLAAMTLETGLICAGESDPDGERNDVPLTPGLVAQVRQHEKGPICWIADRQFAAFHVLDLLSQGHDHFLVRCPCSLTFAPDPARRAQGGLDIEGRRYVQQWGHLGKGKARRYVRRITLARPEQDDILLVTDLLNEAAYPAGQLLAAYRQRWGIEQVFQQVTEVFALDHLIGSTPRATIFQASICFIIYNILQVMKKYLAAGARLSPDRVSTEKVFEDTREEIRCWTRLGQVDQTHRLVPVLGDQQAMGKWLSARLAGQWTDRWRKAPARRRQPRPPTKVAAGHGGHTSVHRILQEARQPPSQPKPRP